MFQNAVYALWSSCRLILVHRELQDTQSPWLCASHSEGISCLIVLSQLFLHLFFISPTGCGHLNCSDLSFIFPSSTPWSKCLAHSRCSISIYRLNIHVFVSIHLMDKLPKAPQSLCFAFCSIVIILRVTKKKYNKLIQDRNFKMQHLIFGIEWVLIMYIICWLWVPVQT